MSILLPGDASAHSDNDCFVYARSGKTIPCENVPEESPKLMHIRARELMSWRGGLLLRSVSNYPYNCVGMIFASRRAWIEIDYIFELLREDNYTMIPSTEIMIGDIVLYRNQGIPTHIALIVDIDQSIGNSIRVISKWGKDPEFIHFQENVPAILGQPSEYWTDRIL